MESLREKLKLATASAHVSLEATAFSIALREGQLPRESSASYLTCLSIVHAVLERSISMSSSPKHQEFFHHCSPKLPLILADLALIKAAKIRTIRPAVLKAIALAGEMILSESSEIELIGYLYVLEGSQNGGVFLKDLFADSLSLPHDKLSYFGCYGDQTRSHWKDFVSQLDALSRNEEETQRIEAAAISAFAGLEQIQNLLLPFSEESLHHNVTSINPEAGSHEMPDDPIQIDVALRAGVRARNSYPYLERRFGDRGQRFTASDSCWLLSLVPLEYKTIQKSISWLRTVLSSRGIPSVILENHMQELVTELEVAVPARAGTTENFRRVISELRAEREKYLAEAEYKNIAAAYQLPLHDLSANLDPLPLLVSAQMDERSGITGAYATTFDWFAALQKSDSPLEKMLSEVSLRLRDFPKET